jgi:hypothetical protein
MASPALGVLMVVSPGEGTLAADSLRRAIACAPSPPQVYVVNNTGEEAMSWLASPGLSGARLQVLTPDEPAPRPYFEIGRTVFGALARIATAAPAWLFKIDPDTLVCAPDFFSDVEELQAMHHPDFVACLVTAASQDHWKRMFRIASDFSPIGATRTAGGRDRYGSALRPRLGRVWYSRLQFRALDRTQPSGGFYAIRGEFLARLAAQNLLANRGANGLEWNDDTLLSLAVRTAGGRICDVRASRFAHGWQWMHGSRYFTNEQARTPGMRALHPVKFDADGRALRAALPVPLAKAP